MQLSSIPEFEFPCQRRWLSRPISSPLLSVSLCPNVLSLLYSRRGRWPISLLVRVGICCSNDSSGPLWLQSGSGRGGRGESWNSHYDYVVSSSPFDQCRCSTWGLSFLCFKLASTCNSKVILAANKTRSVVQCRRTGFLILNFGHQSPGGGTRPVPLTEAHDEDAPGGTCTSTEAEEALEQRIDAQKAGGTYTNSTRSRANSVKKVAPRRGT